MKIMNNTNIYDLRVCSQIEPFGIDISPVFSWKMRSTQMGQKQSAYMISIRKSGKSAFEVWNSGMVMSDESSNIPCGAGLEWATDYEWTLRVWDAKGLPLEARSSRFTTGLPNEEWSDAKWITVYDKTREYATINEYTVETTFKIINKDINFLIGTASYGAYYRFRLWLNKDRICMRAFHSIPQCEYKVCGVEVNISELLDIKVKEVHAHEFDIKFEVIRDKINVIMDGVTVYELEITEDMPPIGCGAPGFHCSGPAHGILLGRMITRDTVTGNILFDYDFEKENPFSNSTVVDGKLRMVATGRIFPKRPSFVVRKSISVTKRPKSAKLFVSGMGVFCAYINGNRVANNTSEGKFYYELTPGNTEIEIRRHYFTYDVTNELNEGKNVLSAIVTSGWWSDLVSVCQGERNGFIAKLIVRYEDGDREVFVTDDSWKADIDACPVGFCSIFSGEEFDATKSTEFMSDGYDDSEWKNADTVEYQGQMTSGFKAAVYNRSDLEHEPVSAVIFDSIRDADEEHYGTVIEKRSYTCENGFVPLTLQPGESAVIDFGYNCAGREAFTVSAKAGTKITVWHAEALNEANGAMSRNNSGPEGDVWLFNLGDLSPARTDYVCKDGEQSYFPLFTYYGFRYIRITADQTITINKLTYQVLSSVRNDEGNITTGNKDVNTLIDNGRRGMWANYLSVPTDCPQRAERCGWTADTQVFTKTAMYYSGDAKPLLEKYLYDLKDCQMSDGKYMNASPRGRCGGSYGAFGWSDAGVFIPYYLYKVYGDKSVIENSYESMQLYVDGYLASTDKKGATIRYGDWLNPLLNSEDTRRVLAVAYYAWVAKYMAEMADAIGKAEDAERYRELFKTEKQFFNEMYVESDGNIKHMTQTVALTTLYLGLVDDPEYVQKYVDYVVKEAVDHDYTVRTGFLGTPMVLPMLSQFGHTDIAYKMLLCKEYPSWLYPIEQGATTMWESWNAFTVADGYRPGGNSLNHYSFGAVVEWIYAYAAGIRYDKAFKKFIVAPEPNSSIGHLKAEYESSYGRIVSEWTYSSDGIEFYIEIPANTSATVKLPCAINNISSINGTRLENLANVYSINEECGATTFLAESGRYRVFVKTK